MSQGFKLEVHRDAPHVSRGYGPTYTDYSTTVRVERLQSTVYKLVGVLVFYPEEGVVTSSLHWFRL